VKSNKGATLPVKLMSGTVASAESLEALAKALQVPFTTLRASIDRWNQSVKSGWDQDFNRPMPAQAQTIDTPPFYYGEERFSIHYTSGGIAISPKAQVLDRDDHPIPGLYAAGETTGGVHGRTRLGGCALTDCFVFGRIAGKEAALRSHKSLRPR
ncbi:FAD-binding protein, partial [Sutterella wadsworthensis]